MSIFGKIMSAIFGTSASAAPGSAPIPGNTQAGATPTSTAPTAKVDVTGLLDNAVKSAGEKLEWRTSIVDLMKALKLDSSLKARQELAKELGYTGDMNDSAKMNIWLHKQVIDKLAANNGQIPADLLKHA